MGNQMTGFQFICGIYVTNPKHIFSSDLKTHTKAGIMQLSYFCPTLPLPQIMVYPFYKMWSFQDIVPLVQYHYKYLFHREILKPISTDFGDFLPMIPETLLPPASEGWGKVLFSFCQFTPQCGSRSSPGGGYPILLTEGPRPRSR